MRSIAVCCIATVLFACEQEPAEDREAGPVDVGAVDGRAVDGRAVDAGAIDAEPDEAGAIDAEPDEAIEEYNCLEDNRWNDDTSSPAACAGADVNDHSTCTPERAGAACRGRAICENDYPGPGDIVSCCDGERWFEVYETPDVCGLPEPLADEGVIAPDCCTDMGVDDPDVGVEPVDAGPFSNSCDGMGADPRDYQSSFEVCGALDTSNPDDCTAAQQYVICAQLVECDGEVFDRGEVIRCCDGEQWVWLDEDPDPCGLPPQPDEPDAGP